MANKKLTYKEWSFPNYVNTTTFFANLDVSDAIRACEVGPCNLFLVSNPGAAKTLVASDIHYNHFGGNKAEGGHSISIRAFPEMDLYNEIFSKLNINRAQRELTDSIDALMFRVDEMNRAPTKAQNQLFPLGDGDMDFQGRSIKLGREGYLFLIATANLENGRKFTGTFDIDPGMYDRSHVVIDLNHYGICEEDHFYLDEKEADPRVKSAPKRDLTEKLIAASKEIKAATKNPGLEAIAVINYIRFGLVNCMLNADEGKTTTKGREWPNRCLDCRFNKEGGKPSLCSLVRDDKDNRRTTDSILLYAAALEFVAKLKDPKIQIDPVDLMFKSFELVGAYKGTLHPGILNKEYHENNPMFMADVCSILKEDFRENEDYILTSIECAQKGKRVTRFFKIGDKFGNYDSLSLKAKEIHTLEEPYKDKRAIGLHWVPILVDYELRKLKVRKQT